GGGGAGGGGGGEGGGRAGARDAARRPQRPLPVRQRQEVQEVPHARRRAGGDGRLSGHDHDGVARVLRLVARKLEDYLDGDDLALETLAEALEQEGATPDDIQTAVLGIRGLAGLGLVGGESAGVAGVAGRHAQRVLSAEERDSLTTEAWGYLLDLRSSGALDADQFERVLDALTSFGERPVEVERAREVAARVALEREDGVSPGEYPHGDQEVAH